MVKKVLLIEELQSDWHQKGRQEGYVNPDSELENAIKTNQDLLNILYGQYQEMDNRYQNRKDVIDKANRKLERARDDYKLFEEQIKDKNVLESLKAEVDKLEQSREELRKEIVAILDDRDEVKSQIYKLKYDIIQLEEIKYTVDDGIPDAPLKESITDFLIKQAIKDAVEGGYDYIAWTTGIQQADRYSLRKVIDELEVLVNPTTKTYEVYAKKDGITQQHLENLTEAQLADTLGKEIASKIVKDAKPIYSNFGDVNEPLQLKTYKDLELETGGEFHKKLYNNYVPRMLKKYGKKWGLTPEMIDIRAGINNRDYLRVLDDEQLITIGTQLGLNDVVNTFAEDDDFNNPEWDMKAFAEKRNNLIDAILGASFTQPSIPVTPQMIEEVMTQGQPLFQLKELPQTNGNLLAMHNITEGKLKSALKLDGFPMASLAVTTIDQPLSDFGEISLLFKKDTIDPKRTTNRVFGADVYSPRFPSPKYKMIYNNEVWGKFRAAEKQSGLSLYQLEADFNMGQPGHENRLMKYTYMNEKGIELDFTSANDIWDRHRIVDDAFNSNNLYDDEYRSWADNQLEQGTNPVFWDRKANKEIPMTLDNALKLMKREEVRGGEGGQYSGALRALATREFTSIKDIKANIDLIVDTDTFEEAKADAEYMQKEAEQILQKYSNYSRMYDEVYSMLNNYFKYGSGIEAMQKGLNAIDSKMYGNMELEDLTKLVEYADWLRDMPTEYFEAKLRRIVGINEIQAVIAPETISPELEQMLKDKGIHLIEKYHPDEDRQQAMDRVLRQNDVSFQLKEADTATNECFSFI